MTKKPTPRKRNATLPRTSHDKREYMHYKATQQGKTLIDYIEDTSAPPRAVKAFVKARNQQHDEDSNTN